MHYSLPTNQSITRSLWILVAMGAPIFGVSFGHLETGFLTIAPSVFFMGVILYFTALCFFMRQPVLSKGVVLSNYKGLAVLLAIFIVIHAVALIYSAWISSDWLGIWGIKNMIKLVFGAILFWMTLLFFPRDEIFIKKFFIISSVVLSCFLAVFIYRFAIVLKLPFMSTDYYNYATSGKNQMVVQAVFFFFYLFSFFFLSNRKLVISPFLISIFFSIIYLESRMGWLATVVGIAYMITYLWRCNKKLGRSFLLKSILAIVIVCSGTIFFLSKHIDLNVMSVRLLSIYNPSAISEADIEFGKRSYWVRGETIQGALKGFLDSPFIGAGLGNTFNYIERPTHNDFVTLLAEMGVLGLGVFLYILWNVWKRGSPPSRCSVQDINWLTMAARTGFLSLLICMNFFNMYLSPYFWIYLALYIVTVETVDKKNLIGQ